MEVLQSLKTIRFYLLIGLLLTGFYACKESPTSEEAASTEERITGITAPQFDEQGAYQYVQKQLSFGPRVPGTPAHKNCAEWLEKELGQFADSVYVQRASLTQPGSGKVYPAINLVASFNQQANDRILLLAHWDSRPWADQDSVNKESPIQAADDGGSGVAVLLQIAKTLKSQQPAKGVDILLVDVEDAGRSEWGDESWCLGSKHWAQNPHIPGYRAMFGICLDMVGARNARFPLEGFSTQYAGSIQLEIWGVARGLGYGNYFVSENAAPITDDHLMINTLAGIPCVDIIHLQGQGSFGAHWHTHQDDLNIIDPATLKAVGQTVLQVVYNQ